MNQFYNYLLSFYGSYGLYPMDVSLAHVKAATRIHKKRSGISFDGDSYDREKVRDILIKDFGYKWPVKEEA